jgi:hypothetical protein
MGMGIEFKGKFRNTVEERRGEGGQMPGRVQSCGCCDVDGWLNGWMDGLPLKMFIFPWREALIFTPEVTKSILWIGKGGRGEEVLHFRERNGKQWG